MRGNKLFENFASVFGCSNKQFWASGLRLSEFCMGLGPGHFTKCDKRAIIKTQTL